jgi:hypothetical protein
MRRRSFNTTTRFGQKYGRSNRRRGRRCVDANDDDYNPAQCPLHTTTHFAILLSSSTISGIKKAFDKLGILIPPFSPLPFLILLLLPVHKSI